MSDLNDSMFLNGIRRHFVCMAGVYVWLDEKGNWIGEETPYCYFKFIIDICGV